MKKLLKAGMAALLICSMGACTKKEEPAPETAEPEVQEETVEPELAGKQPAPGKCIKTHSART